MSIMGKIKQKISDAERIEFAKQIENMYEVAAHVSLKRVALFAFVKGVATGLGVFLGGTLLVGLVLWILSMLGSMPFVGDISDAAQNSIEQGAGG